MTWCHYWSPDRPSLRQFYGLKMKDTDSLIDCRSASENPWRKHPPDWDAIIPLRPGWITQEILIANLNFLEIPSENAHPHQVLHCYGDETLGVGVHFMGTASNVYKVAVFTFKGWIWFIEETLINFCIYENIAIRKIITGDYSRTLSIYYSAQCKSHLLWLVEFTLLLIITSLSFVH